MQVHKPENWGLFIVEFPFIQGINVYPGWFLLAFLTFEAEVKPHEAELIQRLFQFRLGNCVVWVLDLKFLGFESMVANYPLSFCGL